MELKLNLGIKKVNFTVVYEKKNKQIWKRITDVTKILQRLAFVLVVNFLSKH